MLYDMKWPELTSKNLELQRTARFFKDKKNHMRAWLLAAACLKHCLNCCSCISAAIWLWFLGIFHAFCAAVLCGVHLRPAFNPIVEKPPEQIYSIDFYARMTNNSCQTFAYWKKKQNEKPWLKARLLWLMEHETDRIPLGVTIWKQTCTHLSIPELYHPSFLYILLSISLSSR